MLVSHPHFTSDVPNNCYHSNAGMGTFVLRLERGEVIALVSQRDGILPPVHQHPFVVANDEWAALDAIHAKR